MPADIALSFDPARRRLDLCIEDGNLVLDATPVSAMLTALLSERRARTDDDWPRPADPLAPPAVDPRRGWWGDCLDALGEALGSRLWLLARAKQSEATRRFAENAAAEALADLERDRGLAITIAARWTDRGRLGLVVREGAARLALGLVAG